MTAPNLSDLQATTTFFEEVKDLVDNVITVDDYSKAPGNIKELVDTLHSFSRVLSGLQVLLDDYRIVYPNEEEVSKRGLEECLDFIRRTDLRHPRNSVKAIFRRLSHDGHDDERAISLREALLIRTRKVLEFILISSLQPDLASRNVPQASNHPTTGPAIPATNSQPFDDYHFSSMPTEDLLALGSPSIRIPDNDDIRQTIRELISLRNYYDRVTAFSTVAIPKRHSDAADAVDSWLQRIWFRMCVLGGLTYNDGPPVALPGNMVLEAPSRNLIEAILNVARESIHSSIGNPTGHIPQPERLVPHASSTAPNITECRNPTPDTDRRTSTVPSTRSTFMSNSSRRTQSSLSQYQPVLTPCKPVDAIYINDNGVKMGIPLQDYISILYDTGSARKITWRGQDLSFKLEHDLPEDAFPRTFHSKIPNCALHVTFEQNHHFTLYDDRGMRSYSFTREYVFGMPNDLKTFQEIVRGKTLVMTYEIEEIYSDKNPRTKNHNTSGMAMIEDLKIWQSLKYPGHHSLSFFTNNTATHQHVEYDIDQFDRDLWEEPTKKTVRLNFATKKISRKFWLGKLKTSRGPQPNEIPAASTALAIDSLSPRRKRSSGTSNEDTDPNRPAWVNIQFTTREDKFKQNQLISFRTCAYVDYIGYDSFVKEFKAAHDKDQLSSEVKYDELGENFVFPPVSPVTRPPRSVYPRNPSVEEVSPFESDSIDTEDSRQADQWFKDLAQYVLRPLFPDRPDWNEPNGPERVKVAILDTGVRLPEGAEHIYADQLRECRNWLDSDPENNPDGSPFNWEDGEDVDGHGTHVTGLVLKVAPNTEVFVARVFKSQKELQQQNNDLGSTEWRIAQAIRHAVNIWKVDIISMSFGFAEKSDIISKAFDEATTAKPPVLMLAAAANFRNDSNLSWPAKSSRAIGIFNLTGDGYKRRKTPERRRDHTNFAILGYDVRSWWPDDRIVERRMSGTSVATAIAAGVAALIMEIVRQPERRRGMDKVKLEKLKQLGDVDCMTEVFKIMAKEPTPEGYNRIVPWNLLKQGGEPTTIVDTIYQSL